MTTQQSVRSPEAIDAWLEKLDGFEATFDGIIEKIRADESAGCHPPQALLTKVLPVLETVCRRFNWFVHAYCQMSNHYHLVVETPDENLSRGMRQLNGLYTQGFNRGH